MSDESVEAALDAAQKKLQVIFALVEFHQRFTDPMAAQEMYEKIMELKEEQI